MRIIAKNYEKEPKSAQFHKIIKEFLKLQAFLRNGKITENVEKLPKSVK